MNQTNRLYEHTHHPYTPRNANVIHQREREEGGFNSHLAVWLTTRVGSMWAAYIFVMIAAVGLLAIIGVLTPIVALLVAWVSQTFIQLVLLPVIMVGQNVLDRRAELMAEEQFATNNKTLHEVSEIMRHLEAQDAELLRQTTLIVNILHTPTTLDEKLHELDQKVLTAHERQLAVLERLRFITRVEEQELHHIEKMLEPDNGYPVYRREEEEKKELPPFHHQESDNP